MEQLLQAYPLWKDGVEAIRASPELLVMMHALGVAYIYRKHTPRVFLEYSNAFMRGAVLTVVIGLGGGTTAAILTGRTVPWLLNPFLLPAYLSAYLVMPGAFPIMRAFSPLTEIAFDLIDGIIRVYSLASTIEYFRNQPNLPKTPSTRGGWVGGFTPEELILQQIFIGTLSVSCGGILWRWFATTKTAREVVTHQEVEDDETVLRRPPTHWKPLGHDFMVIAIATSIFVMNVPHKYGGGQSVLTKAWLAYEELLLGTGQVWIQEALTKGGWMIRDAASALGVPSRMKVEDWKLVCSAFVVFGFFLRPAAPLPPLPRTVVGGRVGGGGNSPNAVPSSPPRSSSKVDDKKEGEASGLRGRKTAGKHDD